MTGYIISFIAAITWLGRSFYRFLFSTLKFLQEHKVLSLILFSSFVMKLFLAGWNSYWIDELYSVYERGIMFSSASEVLQYHQGRGVGMPLYEYILFIWMSIFGHDEVATRTLSIIYVTLATFFLYLFTLKAFGRRVAIASCLLFTFSYMAIYYSLEARYYGQTLFLCTLSSYLLLLYLDSLNKNYSLKRLFLNEYFILFAFSNVALMLTFPFNYLFIFAQGVFVLLYFLYHNRQAKIMANIIKVSFLYISQLIILSILWEMSTINQVISLFVNAMNRLSISNGYAANSGVINNIAATNESQQLFISFRNPIAIFIDYVVAPNFNLTVESYAGIIVLLIYIMLVFGILIYGLLKYGTSLYRRNINSIFPPRKIYIFYLVLWTFLPCLLVYILFSIGQLDKLRPRYLIYCTPAFIVLIAICLEQAVCLLDRYIKPLLKISLRRYYIRYSLVFAIIATTALTLPGGYSAATYQKDDWRGIANQIVQQVHRDQEHSYIVFQAAYRKPHLLDYYFKRFSDDVRVYDLIKRAEEYQLTKDKDYIPRFMSYEIKRDIDNHDYLVLVFIHDRAMGFPETMKLLLEQYKLTNTQLDDEGRGYLVFKVRSEH